MKPNCLGGMGYLTDEQRKSKLERVLAYSSVSTSIDLSKGVVFTPFSSSGEITLEQYSNDVAAFISLWTRFIVPDLNGFAGFSMIKFELNGKIELPEQPKPKLSDKYAGKVELYDVDLVQSVNSYGNAYLSVQIGGEEVNAINYHVQGFGFEGSAWVYPIEECLKKMGDWLKRRGVEIEVKDFIKSHTTKLEKLPIS